MKNLIVGFLLCFTVLACDSNAIYKSFIDFKDTNWYIKDVPSFTFEVADETIPYDIYVLVRNASQYPYNNLYMTRFIYGPDNKLINKRLEQVILFEPKTGKPKGKGLGDIYDSKVISSRAYRFPKKGKYTIKFQQYMRQDPLPFVMSIGLSVEKPLPPKQ